LRYLVIKEYLLENEGVREKDLSPPAAELGIFCSYMLSLSVVKKLLRTSTPAPGSRVPVNVNALSTLLCPISGARAYRAE
jgi:hypothetical protein